MNVKWGELFALNGIDYCKIERKKKVLCFCFFFKTISFIKWKKIDFLETYLGQLSTSNFRSSFVNGSTSGRVFVAQNDSKPFQIGRKIPLAHILPNVLFLLLQQINTFSLIKFSKFFKFLNFENSKNSGGKVSWTK